MLLVPSRLSRPFSQEFRAINWQGSLLAPETGEYEFPCQDRERHAAFGQRQQPTLDRRPGEVGQRHRVSRVSLSAGRTALPAAAGAISVQGKDLVDRLEWKLPRRAFEVIPERNLSPELGPGNIRPDDAVSTGRSQRRL